MIVSCSALYKYSVSWISKAGRQLWWRKRGDNGFGRTGNGGRKVEFSGVKPGADCAGTEFLPSRPHWFFAFFDNRDLNTVLAKRYAAWRK